MLPWRRHTGKHKFIYLASVAQQMFGNQGAAVQVDRDVGACGNLLVPNRSRIDMYWVELVIPRDQLCEHIPEYGTSP